MDEKHLKRFGQIIYIMDSKIDEIASAELTEVALTREQFYMLELINGEQNMTQKKLIYKLNKEQTAVSRSIKKLVDHGFITKEQSMYDLRSTVLKITSKGEEALKLADDIKSKVVTNFMRELNVTEREQLMTILDKIYQSFTLRDPFRY